MPTSDSSPARPSPAAAPARAPGEDSEPEAAYVRREIPRGASAPALAREVLMQVSELLSSTARYQSQLLVSELISHRIGGAQTGRPGLVVLEIAITHERLRVTMTDADPEAKRTPPRARQPAPGWELELVAQLAERWGVRHGAASTLWFELGA